MFCFPLLDSPTPPSFSSRSCTCFLPSLYTARNYPSSLSISKCLKREKSFYDSYSCYRTALCHSFFSNCLTSTAIPALNFFSPPSLRRSLVATQSFFSVSVLSAPRYLHIPQVSCSLRFLSHRSRVDYLIPGSPLHSPTSIAWNRPSSLS